MMAHGQNDWALELFRRPTLRTFDKIPDFSENIVLINTTVSQ